MLAFVLSGGGNRGPLEVGALQVLLKHGIDPDMLVGTSAGAVNAVKKSLQIGATEGVHLSDEALAGSDAAATSLALAAAIRHLGAEVPADLILTGMASTDGETSLVPAQLAERLGLPQVTFVSSLELDGGYRRRVAIEARIGELELAAYTYVKK